MKKSLNWLFVLILIATSLAVTGCGAQGGQTPTVDPVVIYTQVAQTVQAQITSNAKLTPKATNTPQPTATTPPTATLALTSTPLNGTQTTKVSLSPTVAKTGGATIAAPTIAALTLPASSPQAPATSADAALYVSQTVADGTTFAQNEGFTMTWVIQNVGSTTWDNNYLVRLYAGERFNGEDKSINQTVKPKGQAKIQIDMRAPATRGEYTSVWVLTAPDGHNFSSFTLTIKVK